LPKKSSLKNLFETVQIENFLHFYLQINFCKKNASICMTVEKKQFLVEIGRHKKGLLNM
jgi:hypothetical protein